MQRGRKMKSRLLLIIAVVLVVSGIGAVTFKRFFLSGQSSQTNSFSENHRVDDLAQKPQTFLDKEVRVRGVVGRVYPEKKGIILIDTEEYEKCGLVCPVGHSIPVVIKKEDVPTLEKFVVLTGTLRSTGGQFLFQARNWEDVNK
jgi:hypothetical protein